MLYLTAAILLTFNFYRACDMGLTVAVCSCATQGRSDGGYMGIYTPKISPRRLLWGKITSKRVLNMSIKFYTSQKNNTPKTNFWLRPWRHTRRLFACPRSVATRRSEKFRGLSRRTPRAWTPSRR